MSCNLVAYATILKKNNTVQMILTHDRTNWVKNLLCRIIIDYVVDITSVVTSFF